MATISAADVRELRKVTGAGMMDCKKALKESDGDFDGAIDYLRKKGQKVVAKRAGKDATEGAVMASAENGKGVILSISCETDFAAKNDQFLALATKVSELAQAKLPATKEELLALELDGSPVEEQLKGLTAITGEKIEVSNYFVVEGENIASYIHAGSKIGVLVSYKDGGKAEEASQFFRSVAMHIAAMSPSILSPDEFEEDFVVKEAEALRAQIEAENETNRIENLGKPMKNVPQYASRRQLTPEVLKAAEDAIKEELKAEGKPEKIWDKIVPGKLERFIADNTLLDQERCLLSQFFALDDTKTVAQAVEDFADGAELVEFKRVAVG